MSVGQYHPLALTGLVGHYLAAPWPMYSAAARGRSRMGAGWDSSERGNRGGINSRPCGVTPEIGGGLAVAVGYLEVLDPELAPV